MPNLKEDSRRPYKLYHTRAHSFCKTHEGIHAAGECSSCRRPCCPHCIRISAGKLLCTPCARKEQQDCRFFYNLFVICVILACILALGMLLGGILFPVFLTFSAMSAAAAFLFHRKSLEGMPPAADSDNGYMPYQEATAPHTETVNGAFPLPDYDLRGNPVVASADVLLTGYSIRFSGADAQAAIDMVSVNDQIWLKHDAENESDPYAIYAENKFGWFIGWIPDAERYSKLNKQIADILSDPLYGSVLAFASEKITDEDGYNKIQLRIALYNTPASVKTKG